MKIGLLTGGGDAPGLNGVIEAAGKTLLKAGHQVIGIRDGFDGIFKHDVFQVSHSMLEGLHAQAGTFLGTTNRSGTKGREAEFLKQYQKLNLDGLIVAGGDGTFFGLKGFLNDIPLVGVPKTIDNDLPGTDRTFGFNTACTVVCEAVESLKATADAHRRVMVVEVMGRTAGWIALGGGLAAYADLVLIPERPFAWSQLSEHINQQRLKKRGLVIVVAEGAQPQGGSVTISRVVQGSPEPTRLGGIAHLVSEWIEQETGWESRPVVLGHLQRSRFPTVEDRWLSLSFGFRAAELVNQKKFGKAVALRQGEIVDVNIETFSGQPKTIGSDHVWLRQAQDLGIIL